MTYYDALNSFHKANERKSLPSSAQLLYLHLLHMNNRLGNTGQVHCSDALMSSLTNLSRPSITNAKRILKAEGFIDFKTDKANPRSGTLYILAKFLANDFANNLANHLANPFANPLSNRLANPRGIDSSSNSNNNKDKDKEVEEDAHATAAATTTPLSQNSKAVMDAWLLYEGEKLKGGYAFDFIELENTYGAEALVNAIKAAAQSNTRPRLSYNYVKAVLLNQQKGGGRSENNLNAGVQREEKPSENWGGGLLARIRQQRG